MNNIGKIEKFQNMINRSRKISVFTGVGVSTLSGIPDFRSSGNTDFLSILTKNCFDYYPDVFYNYYRNKLVHLNAKPNIVHMFISELERKSKEITVITQNIDGLHQLAGNSHVIELHGTVKIGTCVSCEDRYTAHDLIEQMKSVKVPVCEKCGAKIKPDVVLYGDMLNGEDLLLANKTVKHSDLLIVMGISLEVHSANNLLIKAKKKRVSTIIVNRDPTEMDHLANLLIHDDFSNIFPILLDD